VAAHFLVVVRAAAHGYGLVRQVRHRHQQIGELLIDVAELRFELLDLLAARLVRRENGRRVEPLLLRARHFLAGCVLLALEPLDARNHLPPLGVERDKRSEDRLRIQAAVAKARAHVIETGADVCGIEHDSRSYNGSAAL